MFCRQKPKSLERVGKNLIIIAMKKLNLEQMESVEAGLKMSCKAALVLYGFAFVGLCVSTGGAAICAAVGFGASVYDVIAAC
ncbi:MAG TPA: hypothetical protein DFI01_01550 [Bacteroidales bacterium]|nr:hypothetical protein [Bacteroidales bacterium]